MTSSDPVPQISPTELHARLEAGDVPTLVDVREDFERAIADLPAHDQITIPSGEFMQRMRELDREAELVVYCRSGGRSEWAVRLLMGAGFARAINLTGGVLAWRVEVDPSLRAY